VDEMNKRGQITAETLMGFGLFIILFIGLSAYIFSQTDFLTNQSNDLSKKNACLSLSQVFYETKNSKVKWMGNFDYNFFVSHDTIYVNYINGVPFEGVYCQTFDTNLQTNILAGDLNIIYSIGSGYVIMQ
jgi:hypothetical protein